MTDAMKWWLGMTWTEYKRLKNSVNAEVQAHGLTREQAIEVVFEQEGAKCQN